MKFATVYESLYSGDKRGMPRFVRDIFVQLLIEGYPSGRVPLALGHDDPDAFALVVGGDQAEARQAFAWLLRFGLVELHGEAQQRTLGVASWDTWKGDPGSRRDTTRATPSSRPAPPSSPSPAPSSSPTNELPRRPMTNAEKCRAYRQRRRAAATPSDTAARHLDFGHVVAGDTDTDTDTASDTKRHHERHRATPSDTMTDTVTVSRDTKTDTERHLKSESLGVADTAASVAKAHETGAIESIDTDRHLGVARHQATPPATPSATPSDTVRDTKRHHDRHFPSRALPSERDGEDKDSREKREDKEEDDDARVRAPAHTRERAHAREAARPTGGERDGGGGGGSDTDGDTERPPNQVTPGRVLALLRGGRFGRLAHLASADAAREVADAASLRAKTLSDVEADLLDVQRQSAAGGWSEETTTKRVFAYVERGQPARLRRRAPDPVADTPESPPTPTPEQQAALLAHREAETERRRVRRAELLRARAAAPVAPASIAAADHAAALEAQRRLLAMRAAAGLASPTPSAPDAPALLVDLLPQAPTTTPSAGPPCHQDELLAAGTTVEPSGDQSADLTLFPAEQSARHSAAPPLRQSAAPDTRDARGDTR